MMLSNVYLFFGADNNDSLDFYLSPELNDPTLKIKDLLELAVTKNVNYTSVNLDYKFSVGVFTAGLQQQGSLELYNSSITNAYSMIITVQDGFFGEEYIIFKGNILRGYTSAMFPTRVNVLEFQESQPTMGNADQVPDTIKKEGLIIKRGENILNKLSFKGKDGKIYGLENIYKQTLSSPINIAINYVDNLENYIDKQSDYFLKQVRDLLKVAGKPANEFSIFGGKYILLHNEPVNIEKKAKTLNLISQVESYNTFDATCTIEIYPNSKEKAYDIGYKIILPSNIKKDSLGRPLEQEWTVTSDSISYDTQIGFTWLISMKNPKEVKNDVK